MDNNLTTRTYTAPTCTLIISSKEQRSRDRQQFEPIDFMLHLDPPDGDELDRVTLSGQPHQLDYLHQIVSQYIAELVAHFPLATPADRPVPPSAAPAPIDADDLATTDPLANDDRLTSRLGILKNLPGLRNSLAKLTSSDRADAGANFTAKPSISRLVNSNKQPDNRQQIRPDDIDSISIGNDEPPTTAPYLTSAGHRSLDHQLHLGTLTNRTSGEIVTLSAIQLFDLATVLDEYVAEHITTGSGEHRAATIGRAEIPVNGNRAAESSPTPTSRSQLPNLPNFAVTPDPSQVYYRTRRSPSSLMSSVPWAVAAVLAVGVPLLMLDPNPNPLKDAVSKVKMFDPAAKTKKSNLVTAKKSNPADLPGAATATTDPSTIATAPTVGTPTPWQAQPVQPPQLPKSLEPAPTKSPSSPQLSTAPLPAAIATTPSAALPSTIDSTAVKSGIAPNPLHTTPAPATPTKIDNTIARTNTTTTPTAKPSTTGIGAVRSSRTPNPALIIPSDAPTSASTKPIAPGKLSVSKRSILIPSPDRSPIANPPIGKPIPFNPPVLEPPSTPTPQTPKKAAKPKPTPVAAKPKPLKAIDPGSNPSPTLEPITPVPRNPNLINPSPSNPEPTESQTPAIVPDRPLQSNANADGNDTASLQETKRYFQGKWKANAAQTNSLQYVIQVSGKSGIVRTVAPQGEAATTYLQQTKLIKPGQKLISPAAAGSSDQKIRVLLQPDGNVDTFTEP